MGVFCFEDEACSGTRQALGTEMGECFSIIRGVLFSHLRGPFLLSMGEKVLLFSVLFFEAFDTITAMSTICMGRTEHVRARWSPVLGLALGPEKETLEHCPFVGVGYPGAIPFVS